MKMCEKIYNWLLENADKILCYEFVAVGVATLYCSFIAFFELKILEGVLGFFIAISLLSTGLYFKSRNYVYEKVLMYLLLPLELLSLVPRMKLARGVSIIALIAFFVVVALLAILSWLTGLLIYIFAFFWAWAFLTLFFGFVTFSLLPLLEKMDEKEKA